MFTLTLKGVPIYKPQIGVHNVYGDPLTAALIYNLTLVCTMFIVTPEWCTP